MEQLARRALAGPISLCSLLLWVVLAAALGMLVGTHHASERQLHACALLPASGTTAATVAAAADGGPPAAPPKLFPDPGTCPELSHVPDGCLLLNETCLDQNMLVLGGEQYSPTLERGASANLPSYDSSGEFNFPYRGLASNADVLQPTGVEGGSPPLALRPFSKFEASKDLQHPQWSCTVPLVYHLPWLYNYGHTLGNAASWLYHNVKAAGLAERVQVAVNTPFGMALPPWAQPFFQPMVERPVTTLADLSARPCAHDGAGGCQARQPRCFAKVLLCRGNPTNKTTELWGSSQHIVRWHTDGWQALLRNPQLLAQHSRAKEPLPTCMFKHATQRAHTSSRVWKVVFHTRKDRLRQFLNLPELLRQCNAWRYVNPATGVTHRACCGTWVFNDVQSSLAVAQLADVFVGTHGANVANSFFMRPGSSIIEVGNPDWGSWIQLHRWWNAQDESTQLMWWGVTVADRTLYMPGEYEQRQIEAGATPCRGDFSKCARDRNLRLPWSPLGAHLGRIAKTNGSMSAYWRLSEAEEVVEVVEPADAQARIRGALEKRTWEQRYSPSALRAP